MRKSGWAAAAGLVSAALLLTACGGGSSGTTGTGGGAPSAGSGSSAGGGNSTSSAGDMSTPSSGTSSSSGTGSKGNGNGAQPRASSGMSSPPPGTVYFTVQRTSKGYVLAEAGKPVYEYAGDSAGKAPTGVSSAWPSVKAQNPQVSAGFTIPGTFGVIGGVATYNGHPLYTYGSKKTLLVHPSAQWKLIPMSASDING